MLRCADESGGQGAEDVYLAACGLRHADTSGGKPMSQSNADMLQFCVEYVEEAGESFADLKTPPVGVHVANISNKTWDYIGKSCPGARHLYDDHVRRSR